jgi:uncharacterized protein involved in outer membrane biogenesis
VNVAAARPWRSPRVLGGVALLVVLGVAACEVAGWPFLARPVERWLSDKLARNVQFEPAAGGSEGGPLRIRLLGGVRVKSPLIEIAAPAWSTAPHMLQAEDARVYLRYRDLWRLQRGEGLRIAALEADRLDVYLERPDATRASWHFGAPRTRPADDDDGLPDFDRLIVRDGRIRYEDTPRRLRLDAHATLSEGAGARGAGGPTGDPAGASPGGSTGASAGVSSGASTGASPAASTGAATAASAPRPGLHVLATGRYGSADVRLQLDADTVLPWVEGDRDAAPVAVRIDARSGASRLQFEGRARDAVRLQGLHGRYDVAGASLARLGDLLGVTLPTTEKFRLAGQLHREGSVWSVVVADAQIGASRLAGEFRYDHAGVRPLLAGRLRGPLLQFADLGPTVGVPARGAAPAARGGRVLPARQFNLPSLRAMDANVLVDVGQVDLGAAFGEPLRPLRTHLRLNDGVLVLDDLEARSAQGRLRGRIELDSRPAEPLWHAQLRWGEVALERWIDQPRKAGQPPWISGRLAGRADLRGRGRSTAQMLSTLDGQVVLRLRGGAVSHLAIEAAGIDVAEALGVLIKGDRALRIHCAVGQWVAEDGIVKPRVMVLDTPDTTIWVDGSIALADERLDLRASAEPKDFSPLALRTPVRVRGSFADPAVSLEKGPLVGRLAISGALAALAPLAALLPFVDPGGSGDADADGGAADCERLIRLAGTPPTPAKVR